MTILSRAYSKAWNEEPRSFLRFPSRTSSASTAIVTRVFGSGSPLLLRTWASAFAAIAASRSGAERIFPLL
jgi:hypothetical protein